MIFTRVRRVQYLSISSLPYQIIAVSPLRFLWASLHQLLTQRDLSVLSLILGQTLLCQLSKTFVTSILLRILYHGLEYLVVPSPASQERSQRPLFPLSGLTRFLLAILTCRFLSIVNLIDLPILTHCILPFLLQQRRMQIPIKRSAPTARLANLHPQFQDVKGFLDNLPVLAHHYI